MSGLIHARWVVTARGLAAVLVKHRAGDFGRCPRVACAGAPVLPLGPSDVPRQATVAVFCPACRDAYHPRSRAAAALDGAYFGTTAAHLLLLTHPSARVAAAGGGGGGKPAPRVFGFRVHAASLEPSGLTHLVRDIRIIESALGDGVKRVFPGEEAPRARLRR